MSSMIPKCAAQSFGETGSSPIDEPVLEQVIEDIENLHLNDRITHESEEQAIYLSFEEAIVLNKNQHSRALFRSSYDFCLKELQRKWGTWNENRPFNLFGVPENRIVSSKWIFVAYKGLYTCLISGDNEDLIFEGPKICMLEDISLLTSLAVAFDRGWHIECIPAARPKSSVRRTYLTAPPHCDLPHMGFELHLWGSYREYCGLGQSLYKEIKKTLINLFQMRETQTGLFVKGDFGPKGIVCLPPHEIVVIASTPALSSDIIDTLSRLLDPLEAYEKPVISNSNVQEFYISDIDIVYQRFWSMKLSMKSVIHELSFLVDLYKSARDTSLICLNHFFHEAKRLLDETSKKCRFDIAFDVSASKYGLGHLPLLLTYLNETRNLGLKWKRHATRKVYKIGAMTDASYMPFELDTIHTGQVFTLNDNAVSARSEEDYKQCNNCNRAELIAMTQSIHGLRVIQCILDDLDIRSCKEVTTDSLRTIQLLESRFKIPQQARELRDEYLEGDLKFTFIHSKDNFADLLTKAVWGYHRERLLRTFFES
ncbi:uncharacterized protein LALA0_S01e05578g [Lachancea lanzarotensis]|uniref:LALA0S01e05578g1_1 n=1 Tax=Lachancea lanzarotensis TaxID=1245769 RepID=A0A0C7N114_9SACH|nr:uncharacterized protein LALA0_S01e05578g [Lachancea lanzarotensis]CEP60212.1 LALA0S01e05578g1_1 [Lachancea lanzarotensis]